jgi:hypothetical protein
MVKLDPVVCRLPKVAQSLRRSTAADHQRENPDGAPGVGQKVPSEEKWLNLCGPRTRTLLLPDEASAPPRCCIPQTGRATAGRVPLFPALFVLRCARRAGEAGGGVSGW